MFDFCLKVNGESSLVMFRFRMIFSTENSVTLVDLSPKEIFVTYSWRYLMFITIPSGNWKCLVTNPLSLDFITYNGTF